MVRLKGGSWQVEGKNQVVVDQATRVGRSCQFCHVCLYAVLFAGLCCVLDLQATLYAKTHNVGRVFGVEMGIYVG